MFDFYIPAKIRRMSKRRQKIAIAKHIRAELDKFVGQPNTPLVRAELTRVLVNKFGVNADITIQPVTPVPYIEFACHVSDHQS